VAIVVDPGKYGEIISAVKQGGTTLTQRRELAYAAFSHTARYDAAVSSWFASELEGEWKKAAGVKGESENSNPGFATTIEVKAQLGNVLRYGENSHQAAAIYRTSGVGAVAGIAQARQYGGKEMSYNNYVDADAALRAAYDFNEPAVAIIKHANPCGLAVGDTIEQAYARAHATDPVSAFGGVIATNRPVNAAMAAAVAEVFTEVIVAPAFDVDALEILTKKPSIRLLVAAPVDPTPVAEMRPISGGVLVQTQDRFQAPGDNPDNWTLVSGEPADAATLADLVFAWRASRCVKSNGILLAKDSAAVGIGMGQVNRVDSARLAVSRAGVERAADSVVASDAFFPFADGLQVVLDAGVRAVVAPGGSVRDEEVIAAAAAAGVTMYFTGTRHFFH
jgi:phosphoribosylaminoimidazolecarboxamide formyltransferase/IMP cyclohydrolase